MCGLTDALEVIGGLNVLSSDLHEGDIDFIQHLQDTADAGVTFQTPKTVWFFSFTRKTDTAESPTGKEARRETRKHR